ncbi:hypothetical protein WR25_22241 [Diploscapter pachys]|uniref:Uncharacterized protein n=1 Tax=Diploscapter pachys TaxID=2018661 RepID=A0A2A2M620_9BILA|nr:hypothetical protein WR25_22241 [Diploscapter pachys]
MGGGAGRNGGMGAFCTGTGCRVVKASSCPYGSVAGPPWIDRRPDSAYRPARSIGAIRWASLNIAGCKSCGAGVAFRRPRPFLYSEVL